MAFILFVLGIPTALIGALWTLNAIASLAGAGTITAGGVLGFLTVATPGVSLFISGIVLMAIGEALLHLSAISRNSRDTLKEIDRLVDHVTGEK